MIKPFHVVFVLGFLAVGLAVIIKGQPSDESSGFTELQRAELAKANDLEIVMGVIKRPAQSISGKHFHPGGEFGFVVKGAVIVETEGLPAVTLSAGDSFYQPPGEWHVVSTTSQGGETVVFRVVQKGQPMVVALD